MPAALVERAPAKINLTLHILARRPDGYHEIESLVAFAGVGDGLTFTPDCSLSLVVLGPGAQACGELSENLVLKAARGLSERIEGLRLGRFVLSKRLPVAAGLGGGSSDAAAALRLLADANGLARNERPVWETAKATGADVPVCLDPKPRIMRGIGEVLSKEIHLPPLAAVLINPGLTLATKDVFAAFDEAPRPRGGSEHMQRWLDIANQSAALLCALARERNDLEASAILLRPEIAGVLGALRDQPGCELARMSGSGATCFGLFASRAAAQKAALSLRSAYPGWWVRATIIG
jgi:4-diphosphocytidyl-2-C-methyl-D-erythritol kinase